MSTKKNRLTASRGETLRRVQTGVRRLTQQLHRLNDVVGSRVELLPGDLEVLDMIGRDGPLSPRDVVAATGIHPATLTGLLDRLEQGGWLTRQPDSADRRRIIVSAELDKGRELARLYAPMSKAIIQICSEYSDEELATIVDFLERTAEASMRVASDMRNTPD